MSISLFRFVDRSSQGRQNKCRGIWWWQKVSPFTPSIPFTSRTLALFASKQIEWLSFSNLPPKPSHPDISFLCLQFSPTCFHEYRYVPHCIPSSVCLCLSLSLPPSVPVILCLCCPSSALLERWRQTMRRSAANYTYSYCCNVLSRIEINSLWAVL